MQLLIRVMRFQSNQLCRSTSPVNSAIYFVVLFFVLEINKKTKITHTWAFTIFLKPAHLHVQKVVDKEFLIALGKRVRELRLSKEMTQEDLGYIVGNSGKQIGRIERGENNVTTSMIFQISKALNISLSELFDFPVKSNK